MSKYTMVMGPTLVSQEMFDYESVDMAKANSEEGKKWADLKYVFGWDNPLQSFFLQVHDAFVEDPDANPVVWLGVPNGMPEDVEMQEVDDLAREAVKLGLVIPQSMRGTLQVEKNQGL